LAAAAQPAARGAFSENGQQGMSRHVPAQDIDDGGRHEGAASELRIERAASALSAAAGSRGPQRTTMSTVSNA
jgi:hypothetical protein